MQPRIATILSLVLWAVVLSWSTLAPAAADTPKHLALVIGNSGYQELRRLRNAGNDARAVAERLQALGFTLIGKDGKPIVDGCPNPRIVGEEWVEEL